MSNFNFKFNSKSQSHFIFRFRFSFSLWFTFTIPYIHHERKGKGRDGERSFNFILCTQFLAIFFNVFLHSKSWCGVVWCGIHTMSVCMHACLCEKWESDDEHGKKWIKSKKEKINLDFFSFLFFFFFVFFFFYLRSFIRNLRSHRSSSNV